MPDSTLHLEYATKELSPETWPDFERLFAPGTGWAFCACMLYQRGCHLPKAAYPNREAMRIQNRAEKRALVNGGRAHGILVYDDGEPIGWCQFGPVEELPLPGGGRRDRRIPPLGDGVRWRRRGVASTALRAALDAIRERGGGLVEAYPTVTPRDGNWAHVGTIPLFEREGFTVASRPNAPYVVMQRDV
jgi:GNAT superfamily N-acetyltransferase